MSSLALRRLLDVHGVLGAFTSAPSGELMLSDMPEGHARVALEATAVRLGNLFQSADETLSESRAISLCFAEHQLHARRYTGGLLCVLTASAYDRVELGVVTGRVLDELRLQLGGQTASNQTGR